MKKAVKQGLILFSVAFFGGLTAVLVGDLVTGSKSWNSAKGRVLAGFKQGGA